LQHLLSFCVEADDVEITGGNVRYTSHRTYNWLIGITEELLRNDIVAAANNSTALSLLADETADITGIQKLSLLIRFVDLEQEEKILEVTFVFSPSRAGVSKPFCPRAT